MLDSNAKTLKMKLETNNERLILEESEFLEKGYKSAATAAITSLNECLRFYCQTIFLLICHGFLLICVIFFLKNIIYFFEKKHFMFANSKFTITFAAIFRVCET